jgi:hypothetical protein
MDIKGSIVRGKRQGSGRLNFGQKHLMHQLFTDHPHDQRNPFPPFYVLVHAIVEFFTPTPVHLSIGNIGNHRNTFP